MAIQSDETLVTKGDLKTLYTDKILPYLGGNMMMQTGVSDYYSTTEKVVGIWLDGKPVYQKTIECGSLPNNTKKAIAYNISNLDKVVYFNGTACGRASDNKYYSFTFPNVGTANQYTYDIAIDITGDYLDITTQTDRTWLTGWVTLQYTKTTDTTSSALTTPGCYDLNRPDLWPENKEIFFGNGLYGSRLIGNATLEVGGRQDAVLTGSITNNTRLISQGGQLKTPNNWSLPLAMSFSLTYEVPRIEAFIYPLYTEGKLKMYMLVNNPNDVGTYNYDVWVTYTK